MDNVVDGDDGGDGNDDGDDVTLISKNNAV